MMTVKMRELLGKEIKEMEKWVQRKKLAVEFIYIDHK